MSNLSAVFRVTPVLAVVLALALGCRSNSVGTKGVGNAGGSTGTNVARRDGAAGRGQGRARLGDLHPRQVPEPR